MSVRRAGEPAVPFSILDSEARRHTLDQHRGHWLLLVFHRHLG